MEMFWKTARNRKGIAILMVIAAIMFLSTTALDFFSDSLRGHQIALNEKARYQSYYLALSGVQFSKLLLYYNKQIESTLEKQGISATDMGYQPLYRMFPLSSELLRGLVQTEEGEEDAEEAIPEDVEDTGDTGDAEDTVSDAEQGVGLLKQEELSAFLDFTGDFSSEISEEQSKYSLNAITKMTSNSSEYDLFKRILLSILQKPRFKNFFKNPERDSEDLVHALADFVDSNDTINDFDKVERGQEESIYKGVSYKVKNAPYLTLSEIRLVSGMSDDIFATLEPFVTIYHTDSKINICLTDEEIVDTLILHYTRYAGCTAPIKEDDAETLAKLREAILAYCPDKSEVAKALNTELGLQTTATTEEAATTAETKSTASMVSDCTIQFEDLITDANTVFRVKAVGTVGDITTTITQIWDTSASQASAWKIYYHQVD